MSTGMEKKRFEMESERDSDTEDRAEEKDSEDAMDRTDTEDRGEPGDREDVADSEAEEETADIEWENRILCEDGNCIGVIGPDGFCKECGRPYKGSGKAFSPKKKMESPNFAGVDENDDNPHADEPKTGDSTGNGQDGEEECPANKTRSDLEWERRKLCSDGNCIGVIGPDGLCKECGKPYEGDV